MRVAISLARRNNPFNGRAWYSHTGAKPPTNQTYKSPIIGATFYAAKTPFTKIEPVNQSIETRQLMVFAGLYKIDSNAFADRI
ncbi:Translation factor guf1 mitochondrial [Puccinia graminis f. sp. tritici]|uniref:Translation factor guf1 mitochondrial n=1 Tax=Puccinia graminis f. sp. tritici TaxID=56615 RepID=A0A5B0PI77_PUCGR|nr:Translation factor guf1 mitochondrial [Puccinia graminis f. sp. tritici]